MSPASIAFLWHMHQPFYYDRITGEVSMPWVRLHATKGYYDMISILEDFPAIKATFNLVPSLLTQLLAYCTGTAKDAFYEYSLVPAEELTPEQKKFILRQFFQANWPNMISPNKRYWELLAERGLYIGPDTIDDSMISKFNTRAYRDIQVWFNLVWFGYRARKYYPSLDEFIRKGRYFTEDDKHEILSIQMKIVREILPFYKRLQESKQVELTTSPFYHPILPLLCDTEFAWRSMPGKRLPERFCHPEDAQEQINKAVDFHKKIFGTPPKGMWPSEGSVCPELVPLVRNAGIDWIATDEAILAHTLESHNVYDHLYFPYRAHHDDKEVAIIFRDQGLSDMVAYGYSRNKPQEASDDLVFRLRRIASAYEGSERQPLVSIILDGENAWENYSCGGREFLSMLYEKLSADEALQTVSISEFLARYPDKPRLDNLHTGSWLGHNFDIWIGEPEENAAWDCVNRTRKFLKKFEEKNGAQAPGLSEAWENLYAAEGSDWFWWYGPDFSTDNDPEFDRIFRMHLQNVFKAIKVDVPYYLSTPILHKKKPPVGCAPISLIQPTVDGYMTNFYEWQGAGFYECGRDSTAIALGCRYLTLIHYGFDLHSLYLRFDLDVATGVRPEDSAVKLDVCFVRPRHYRLTMPLYLDFTDEKRFTLESSHDGIGFEKVRDYESIAWKKILELSIPFADLGFQPGQEVEFFACLKNDRVQIMRFPREGFLKFTTPEESFEAEMWVV